MNYSRIIIAKDEKSILSDDMAKADLVLLERENAGWPLYTVLKSKVLKQGAMYEDLNVLIENIRILEEKK